MKFLKWVLVLLVLGVGIWFFYRSQFGPGEKAGSIYIPKGSTVNQVAEMLHQQGVIRSPWAFKTWVRFKKAGAALQPGEYEFSAGMTPREVLGKIVRGERVVHKLIIPEGYSFSQIAQAIEKAGIAPAAEILKHYQDPLLIKKLGLPVTSLEGFLFPATYDYDQGTQANELLQKMVETFLKNFDKSLREQTMAVGWNIPQIVTLASIIEKETGQAAERPMISSVFHNRLRLGMKLESDPTVIFGLPNFDGNIRKTDLQNPHPYNTYVHPGLPPGPIASPGKESLKAALNPVSTSYLFFVAKGDGTHQFSMTLEEHLEAVAKYQLKQITETQPKATPKSDNGPVTTDQ